MIVNVLKGSIRLTVEGEEFYLRGGESYVVPPHQVHSAEILEETRVLDVFIPVREDLKQIEDEYRKRNLH